MKNRVALFIFSIVILVSLALSACGGKGQAQAGKAPVPPSNPSMILATTTSTQDSGLLDVFIPAFEAKTGYTVKVVAVGSGAALKMGQEGNADVLLVHSPAAEKTFMADGYGSDRRLVMHNYFLIVGPAGDPAGIKAAKSAVEAFQKIAAADAPFISRGDQSGTNAMELSLWKSANLDPKGTQAAWYIESGQGMGATLTIASEKDAYTLSDRATFLANKANLSLEILYEQDAALLNVYHVIIVNHDKWPGTNLTGAQAFSDYIVSAEGQAIISSFGKDKYGEALFVPDAGKTDSQLGLK
jgi:tungstate transport system substrate-binding protein